MSKKIPLCRGLAALATVPAMVFALSGAASANSLADTDQSQLAYQSNRTIQQARGGIAVSGQVAPIQASAPISVLSSGSSANHQSNTSAADASAGNATATMQGIDQSQLAGPSSSGSGGTWGCDQSEGAGQANSTRQNAEGGLALSGQLVPVQLNVPISVLSSGSSTNSQSNASTADASASNTSATAQQIRQDEACRSAHEASQSKPRYYCQHPSWGHSSGHSWWTHRSTQWQKSGQVNRTGQRATGGTAVSGQIAPVQSNTPVSALGSGSSTSTQSNAASAAAPAHNGNGTGQGAQQSQATKPSGPSSWGTSKSSQSQQAAQSNATRQRATGGVAVSGQVLPIQLNAPISVLSSGSSTNNQSNTSTAKASGNNTNATSQKAAQTQQSSGSGTKHWGSSRSSQSQSAVQSNATRQHATGGVAVSGQVLPVQVNAPVSVLSSGNSTNTQSNSSSANASAGNSTTTVQGLVQSIG